MTNSELRMLQDWMSQQHNELKDELGKLDRKISFVTANMVLKGECKDCKQETLSAALRLSEETKETAARLSEETKATAVHILELCNNFVDKRLFVGASIMLGCVATIIGIVGKFF